MPLRASTSPVCAPVPVDVKRLGGRNDDNLPLRAMQLWLVAEVGRLRLPAASKHGVTLPTLGPAQVLSQNNGAFPRFVRVMPSPGGGAALTLFNTSAGASVEGAVPQNMAAPGFEVFDCVLLPDENLYGQNQGGGNTRVLVLEVDVPL